MPLEHKTALVIESESMVLADLENTLGEMGYSCLGFASAAQVPDVGELGHISLALVDWQPESKALALRLSAAGVPVILTTAGVDASPPNSLVLRKPYLLAGLHSLVSAATTPFGGHNA